jgi:FkbM family methyltransferase
MTLERITRCSLLLAKLCGPQGRVIAFEPIPEIAAGLRENIALNGFSSVTYVEMAVSDGNGAQFFSRGNHLGAAHFAEAEPAQLSVRTTTIDSYVFEQKNPAPHFIKMDVEGAEGKVLAGAVQTLEKHRPALLVDLHTPEQDRAVGRILSRFSYDAIRTRDHSRVRDLRKGWPDPDSLWGQIVALPSKS